MARSSGMPEDLLNNKKKNTSSSSSTITTDKNNSSDTLTEQQENSGTTDGSDENSATNSASSSMNSDGINFHKLMKDSSDTHLSIERDVMEGQKQQAIQVNKGREWNGDERLQKGYQLYP